MEIPAKWQRYKCEDYFASVLAERGWWSESGQYWYIEPSERLEERWSDGFLIIGGPGVNGIRWGYRVGHSGVWAHYPIDDEYVRVADTAESLRTGYEDGSITV